MKNRILPEIVKEVREKGYHDVTLDALRPAFECEGKENTCVEERILVWAVHNHIVYEYKEVGQHTVVRFWGKGG